MLRTQCSKKAYSRNDHHDRLRHNNRHHGSVPFPSLPHASRHHPETNLPKVLTFPIAIVWKVRINRRQKFGLGTTLCLSVVMIIIAVIRISGIRLEGGEVDIVWLAFWQQQECSIAIIMVSLTAFRSLFVADAQARRPRYTPSTWRERMVWNRHHRDSRSSAKGAMGELPQIPSATMTGLRTMIRGSRALTTVDEPGTEQWARPMEARTALGNQRFPVERVRTTHPPLVDTQLLINYVRGINR